MDLKKGQIVPLMIERLAYGGDGIGKYEGRVTFVPNVVPGDQLQVALTKIKSNRMEAHLEELVVPSPERIQPRCSHFDVCGGCTWQMLPYEDQLKYKEQQVREALHHVGGFPEELVDRVVRPILGCETPWAYRNKMEFSFGTPSLEDQTPMLGLHKPKQRYSVFNLNECFLPSPVMAEIVTKVREFVLEEKLTVYHEGRREGLLRNLLIREGVHTGEFMVALLTSGEPFEAADRFKELFEGDERIASTLHVVKIQQRGVRTSYQTKVLAGNPVIHEELRLEDGRSLRFEISLEAFFQPNTKQAELLYGQAITLAGLTGDEVVYDLYCGTGTIGMFCAHAAKEVVGIELNAEAVENARKNATHNELENIRFAAGDVGKMLDSSLPTPDVVIVDPPRAGLQGDTPHKVADLQAPKLVYVSCNPATLSRDLQLFTQRGYKIEAVQPVDMFPHTYHIETVVCLSL
jgi:23S rRNA (uracil1939-C5)-methyltransferase